MELITKERCLIALKDDPERDTVHQPFTAFNQGFDARLHHLRYSDNPYRRGSEYWRWWDIGFSECVKLSDSRCLTDRKH